MCALFSLLPLITLILRLNSGVSQAQRDLRCQRSNRYPPHPTPPQIPVLSLNLSSLLFTAASSNPPTTTTTARFLVSLCCSFVSPRQKKVPLMDPPPQTSHITSTTGPASSSLRCRVASVKFKVVAPHKVPPEARLCVGPVALNQSGVCCQGVSAEAAARHK